MLPQQEHLPSPGDTRVLIPNQLHIADRWIRAETAVRETAEETGVTIEVIGLIGIYSNPRHVIGFSDGEVRQEFSICFRGRPVAGKLSASDESSEVRWVAPDQLDELRVHPSIRLRIDHGLAERAGPFYT